MLFSAPKKIAAFWALAACALQAGQTVFTMENHASSSWTLVDKTPGLPGGATQILFVAPAPGSARATPLETRVGWVIPKGSALTFAARADARHTSLTLEFAPNLSGGGSGGKVSRLHLAPLSPADPEAGLGAPSFRCVIHGDGSVSMTSSQPPQRMTMEDFDENGIPKCLAGPLPPPPPPSPWLSLPRGTGGGGRTPPESPDWARGEHKASAPSPSSGSSPSPSTSSTDSPLSTLSSPPPPMPLPPPATMPAAGMVCLRNDSGRPWFLFAAECRSAFRILASEDGKDRLESRSAHTGEAFFHLPVRGSLTIALAEPGSDGLAFMLLDNGLSNPRNACMVLPQDGVPTFTGDAKDETDLAEAFGAVLKGSPADPRTFRITRDSW